MEQTSTLEAISAENKQLRKELDNALKALGLACDRLIESQEEMRRIKRYLVSLEEAKGA